MAFTHTIGRYASFATVSSIPGPVIDTFWIIIDNYLKDVFELDSIINFKLINRNGELSVRFSQDSELETSLIVDTILSFDTSWPTLFHAVDNMGRETIMQPEEI